MLKDYEFDDDNKSDELQNDGIVMLKGIQLTFLLFNYFVIEFNKLFVFCQSDNPRKKSLRILSTALNLERIPLIGFGTYAVKTPPVINNALSVGYLQDLAENYNNLQHVKQVLSLALAPLMEGGLGIKRKDIWITMKIPIQSINNISALLAEVGTDYFDLLLYH